MIVLMQHSLLSTSRFIHQTNLYFFPELTLVNVPINVDHRRPFLASFGSIFSLSFPDFDALQTFTSKQSINDVYELHESFNVVYNVLVYIYIQTHMSVSFILLSCP